MNRFRKRPVDIVASQWWEPGDHPSVRPFRRADVLGSATCRHCGQTMDEHGWVSTLEGGHIVCPSDWIITGVRGEKYPCKAGIFSETYEPVE